MPLQPKFFGGSPLIHEEEGALQRSGKSLASKKCALALEKTQAVLLKQPNAPPSSRHFEFAFISSHPSSFANSLPGSNASALSES